MINYLASRGVSGNRGNPPAYAPDLDATLQFTPVAVETIGVFGPRTKSFFQGLSCRIRSSAGEEKAYFYLSERVSVAIQKGTSSSIMGTIEPMSMDDFKE